MTQKDDAVALIASGELNVLEAQIVEAFIADPELSAKNVAEKLNLAPKAVLDLLKRAKVRKAIGLGFLTENKDRLTAVRNSVILALRLITEYDPKDAFAADGSQLHVMDMPDSIRFAIKGMKPSKNGGMELTFYDRAAILLELLRYTSKPDPLGEKEEEDKTSIVYYEARPEGEEEVTGE